MTKLVNCRQYTSCALQQKEQLIYQNDRNQWIYPGIVQGLLGNYTLNQLAGVATYTAVQGDPLSSSTMNSGVIQQKPSQGAQAWRSLFFFLFMCEDIRNESSVEFSVYHNGHLLALQHVRYLVSSLRYVENAGINVFLPLLPFSPPSYHYQT